MENLPVEIERKYIIKIPDLSSVRANSGYKTTEITQIYLNSSDRVTHRIRKSVGSDGISYTETKKIRIDKISALEDEREISLERFEELSKNIKDGTRPIKKTRHKFTLGGQKYEVDIYPEWKETCILETELTSKDVDVRMPAFIEIIREVSGIREYSNAAMSYKFPEEIKSL
jgi:CYTH domain-containing protein